jgi:phage shock protein A
MADLQSNISSLVPSNITNTLSQIQNPQSFGDQLLDNAKKQVINAALGIVQKLKDEIQKTILRKIEFEKNHIKKLLELSKQNIGTTTYEFGRVIEIPPTLSDEEFQDAVALENFSYEKEKLIIDKNLKGLKDRLQKILLDPFIKIKTDYAQFKGKVAGRKLNRESLKQLYKSEKVQQLLKNVFKGLVQITASLLTGELIKVIANSAELQELVDKTNEIIDNAVTLPQLNQARIARNGAISTINRQENRIRAILKVLQTLNVILTIFGILTAILNIIPVPSPFGVLAKPATIKWSNATPPTGTPNQTDIIGLSFINIGGTFVEILGNISTFG